MRRQNNILSAQFYNDLVYIAEYNFIVTAAAMGSFAAIYLKKLTLNHFIEDEKTSYTSDIIDIAIGAAGAKMAGNLAYLIISGLYLNSEKNTRINKNDVTGIALNTGTSIAFSNKALEYIYGEDYSYFSGLGF